MKALAVLQIVPGIEAMVVGKQTELLVTPIPIMAKLVGDRLPQPAVYLLVVGHGQQGKVNGMPKDPEMVRVMLQTRRTPVHFSVSDVRVGATWLGRVPPQSKH